MKKNHSMNTFFYWFFIGFIFACDVLGLLLLTGCQPKDETLYDKESGCMVQFRDDFGELQKTQCKYGVASTKVPTPLYEGGPMVTWCVCKPWRFSSDPADAPAPPPTSPYSSHP